ncbi:Type II secretion system (T2SS), protein E, N-terminal domain [Nannocystis exedens]|uniref:Type II secretion system (T2SS), protein E, N-terminal domain n=2 Tax=Nannocystis exedens TaxID=54 RepID=A0A1I1SYB3_9BACT|nr:hypothetical protein NAEX_08735 [Nannocystis exedens]SFD48020.1 Type II secretion system (T2SS), protein E, N-terminal domain [Nannocystis exedens]
MVRAGLLSDEQLAAVQATSAERKLSFVEALLAHSFADEDSVVGFLHSKLMIPKVGASILDGVDRSALDRIPGELAARHAVLPISSDETGNLTLAMVDPTDMKAVDAISAHTGAYLVRAVAPLRVIRSSIAHHYGIPAPILPSLQSTKPATAATPAAVIPAGASTPVPGASQSRAAPAAAISVPTVTPPTVTPPTVGAPGVSPPNGAHAPVVPPVVEPPGGAGPGPNAARPSAPSGAAIRPAAVLQPSAVLMPGAPRPAAVLPAAAFAPSPYGITPQPSAPVVAPTASAPAAAPVPPVSPPGNVTQPFGSSSLAAALAATPAAATAPAGNVTQPLGSANLAAPPVVASPVSSTSPAAGHVTQPFASSSIAAPTLAAPVPSTSPAPGNGTREFASSSLSAPVAAASKVPTAPVPSASSAAAVAEPVDGKTVPVFSGAMATLRPADEVDTSRGRTEPGTESAADTLASAARNADDLDIPLDDLESDRGGASEPGPGEATFDAAKTQTWIPPSFTAANEIIPLSPEAFHRLLPRFATVKTRDEVTDLLLDFLAEGFSRVIMFVHVKGEIRGRDARGEDLLVEAVRQIRIPANGPSVFSGVIERRAPYFGPMRTDTPIDAAFFSALGGVEGVILVLPVLLREKVPLIVFASGSSNPVDPRSLHELTHEVAAALERIIVLEKARGK